MRLHGVGSRCVYSTGHNASLLLTHGTTSSVLVLSSESELTQAPGVTMQAVLAGHLPSRPTHGPCSEQPSLLTATATPAGPLPAPAPQSASSQAAIQAAGRRSAVTALGRAHQASSSCPAARVASSPTLAGGNWTAGAVAATGAARLPVSCSPRTAWVVALCCRMVSQTAWQQPVQQGHQLRRGQRRGVMQQARGVWRLGHSQERRWGSQRHESQQLTVSPSRSTWTRLS